MKILTVLSGLLALLSACGPGGSEPTYYDGVGTIITVINEDHVKIEHDAIPDFMDAMTMNFEVEDPFLLQDLEPGMDVRFRVAVVDRDVYIDQIERGVRAGK